MTQKKFFKQAGEELLKLTPLAHEGQSNFIDILVNEGNDVNDIPMEKAWKMLRPYISDARKNIYMPPQEYRIWEVVELTYGVKGDQDSITRILPLIKKRVQEILDEFDDRPKM